MPMRYFAQDGDSDTLHGLHRYGPPGEIFVEQYFAGGVWHDDPDTPIAALVFIGEGWYTELSEEQAREHCPKAFLYSS